MNSPSLSFEELEALHDVIEAARCFWNNHPLARQRAANTLKTVNRLYSKLGEELPLIGAPSERFQAVSYQLPGTIVDEIVAMALSLSQNYSVHHDPWWADTLLISPKIARKLSGDELLELESNLERLGMILFCDKNLHDDQISVERRDLGPWPEFAVVCS